MGKADAIERALDRLGELRHEDASDFVADELREFLGGRSNLVVAKAAKVACELKISALVPDLVAAFHRFMADAPRLDKRCVASTEIVRALYELDYDEPEPFLKGLKHVQLEASFGLPVDEAARLRGLCAQGLLRTRHPDVLAEIVPLLVDKEPAARVGAIRALAVNGEEAGILLLRLKVLTGDGETEVLGECFAGLLAASPNKSLPFVASYIDSDDSAIADAAVLVLGESRLQSAFEILKEKWERTATKAGKKVLLMSMAASRLEEAFEFLVSLVEAANVQTATEVVEALAIYRRSERMLELVKDAVSRRGEKELSEKFRSEFESQG